MPLCFFLFETDGLGQCPLAMGKTCPNCLAPDSTTGLATPRGIVLASLQCFWTPMGLGMLLGFWLHMPHCIALSDQLDWAIFLGIVLDKAHYIALRHLRIALGRRRA